MAPRFEQQPDEPDIERPRTARLAQFLLIAAIMVLIAIAVISFN